MRRKAIDQIQGETLAYRCDPADPFTTDVEALLDASLYFRRARDPGNVSRSALRKGRENIRPQVADHLEFLLFDRNGDTNPFDKWSDGQKHVFYIAALLSEVKPDVVLIDEPENHLHPTYMTRVLELLKRRVLQTIVATHHPHIIFSNYVDRVFFLDTARPGTHSNPPDTTSHNKLRVGKTPRRIVRTLETDFDKITAAYALFANQDNQLLRQAAWIEQQSDLVFFTALHNVLAERAAGPGNAPIPDSQSRQLASELKKILPTVPQGPVAKILDIGSGIGRTALEISKLPAWRDGQISWTCWEPDAQKRRLLSERLRVAGLQARILDDIEEVVEEVFDVCVIANVLHEVTPETAAQLIVQVEGRMAKPHAALVILELFPLLRPEKFAVPYPGDLLAGLFATSGFNVRCHRVSVAGGSASAYAIAAKRTDEASKLVEAEIYKKFEDMWLLLAEQAVSSYAATTVVDEVADYRTLLNDLTTLASVTAWRTGRWGKIRTPDGQIAVNL